MSFLKRNGHYYYNRRVPEIYAEFDNRCIVRISLETTSKHLALRKAIVHDDQIEAYWQDLASANATYNKGKFDKAVRIARGMGISYLPKAQVAALPLDELVSRILLLKDATPKQVEIALGGKEEQEYRLSQLLDLFWPLSNDKIVDKGKDQVRKWRNPRIKAVNNFIAVIGDKALQKITRDDVIRFRDWWLERIKTEGKNAATANKDIIHVKAILHVVCDHYKIALNIPHLFRKVVIEERFEKATLPFTTDQIVSMLNSNKLADLPTEYRWFLYASAETGARPTELLGLLPEDIVLDADVPHICIKDRKGRPLKTKHSAREIPLVGYALEAFKAFPNGFPEYRDYPDKFTTALNRLLRERGLLPTDQHSLYSFRHSFQDRILGVNAPDRVQADLMGHRFHRQKYGAGPSLEQKQYRLLKVILWQSEG